MRGREARASRQIHGLEVAGSNPAPATKNPLLSTTTSFGRIRGFTITLLFHLKGRELRVKDLIDLTGKYRQYVSKYLYRMRNYGLTEKKGPFWRLTPEGDSFLSYITLLNNNIIRRQKEDRKKTFRRQMEDTYIPKTVSYTHLTLPTKA